ncbi:hypothetical protein K431DRAFT_324024 [Polychaeton citri CBS 116435]|uniref:Uncharacterized protein n=1 Tax=Polychaeton citri CBS 116435 TaxID=1314669 RepID=A0A9P4Q127_9PEZI|nr:hypothetical protein K431DRAFT_324024 [Polychaeton citri CBS 116435]
MGELAAGMISGALVAPLVTVIDRSIVEKSSSSRPLIHLLRMNAFEALERPGRFVSSRPFGLVWALYAATFCVANGAETIAKELCSGSIGSTVFASIFLTNVPLGIWKDVWFARLFGAGGLAIATGAAKITPSSPCAPYPVPGSHISRAALLTFLARDGVTIFGSFTLAPRLSMCIPDKLFADPHAQMILTQIFVPITTQVGATPLHLLGLDYQSRQQRVSLFDRLSRLRRDLFPITWIRCVRIVPAYSFGCIANSELRSLFQSQT